jgi:hypothetical protein
MVPAYCSFHRKVGKMPNQPASQISFDLLENREITLLHMVRAVQQIYSYSLST